MALTKVDLNQIDGSTGSITTASISNIKNPSSGSNNIVLNSDGTTTLTPSNIIKSGTAQASTSGVAIDFTGIPSWVKQITVIFNGVSTNGSSNFLVQIGSGSVTTTGYTSNASFASTQVAASTGFIATATNGAALVSTGLVKIALLGSNTWVESGNIFNTGNCIHVSAGNLSLGGVLTTVRLTTVNGTDTFTAGSVNVLYE